MVCAVRNLLNGEDQKGKPTVSLGNSWICKKKPPSFLFFFFFFHYFPPAYLYLIKQAWVLFPSRRPLFFFSLRSTLLFNTPYVCLFVFLKKTEIWNIFRSWELTKLGFFFLASRREITKVIMWVSRHPSQVFVQSFCWTNYILETEKQTRKILCDFSRSPYCSYFFLSFFFFFLTGWRGH